MNATLSLSRPPVLRASQGRTPRRILMTADPLGSIWDFAVELCRSWSAVGTHVLLATMGAPLRPDQWEAVKRIPRLRLEESSYRLEWMADPWDDVARAGGWLLELEEDWEPEIIHLNHYVHGALPWQAPVLMTAHSCQLSSWEAVHGNPAPASMERYAHAVAHGLHSPQLVVVPNLIMKDSLEHHYGSLNRVQVIAGGLKAADAVCCQPRDPFILTTGALWDEAANLSVLSEAAPGLDWPVVTAGEVRAPGAQTLQQWEHLHHAGTPTPTLLKRLMGRASIYALPALHEPSGLAALPAALSGCALVLADLPVLRQAWGECAVYADPRDPDAWHQALQRLIQDDRVRRRMADLAGNRALTYPASRTHLAYQNACISLLETARHPASLHLV